MAISTQISRNVESYVPVSTGCLELYLEHFCVKSYLFILALDHFNKTWDLHQQIPDDIKFFIIEKLKAIAFDNGFVKFKEIRENVEKITFCDTINKCCGIIFNLKQSFEHSISMHKPNRHLLQRWMQGRICFYCKNLRCHDCISYCRDPFKFGYRKDAYYLCNTCKINKKHLTYLFFLEFFLSNNR